MVFVWNSFGLILTYVGYYMRYISLSPVFLTGSIIFFVSGIQGVWIYIGYTTRTILFQSTYDFQNWVQFIRINDIAFCFPMLLVCTLSVGRDMVVVSDLQTVFGFSTTSLTLLIAQEILGMIVHEHMAFQQLSLGTTSDRSIAILQKTAIQEWVKLVVNNIVWLLISTTMVACGMMVWSLYIYYSKAVWWMGASGEGFPFSAEFELLASFLPCYGILGFSVNVVRCYLRWIYPGSPSTAHTRYVGYITLQKKLDLALTIVWDIVGVFFKAYACAIFCTVLFDHVE